MGLSLRIFPAAHVANLRKDEEKGKYFRILPNHGAPSGSPYTQDNVALAKRANKVYPMTFKRFPMGRCSLKVQRRKTAERRRSENRKQCVQRSRVLQSPLLAGAGILREMDALKSGVLRETHKKSFASGLVPIEHEVSPNAEISCFAWDSATSSALACSSIITLAVCSDMLTASSPWV